MSESVKFATLREACQDDLQAIKIDALKARCKTALGGVSLAASVVSGISPRTVELISLPVVSFTLTNLLFSIGCGITYSGFQRLWRANDAGAEIEWIQKVAEEYNVADLLLPLPITAGALEQLAPLMQRPALPATVT